MKFQMHYRWHPLLLPLWHGRSPSETLNSLSQAAPFRPALTVASPDLSQVAAALAGLFAELDDIPARRLGGDGHLSHSLFPIAEVHRQDHLREEYKRSGGHWHRSGLMMLMVTLTGNKIYKLWKNNMKMENHSLKMCSAWNLHYIRHEKICNYLTVWFKDKA